jgi:hypothetical protein
MWLPQKSTLQIAPYRLGSNLGRVRRPPKTEYFCVFTQPRPISVGRQQGLDRRQSNAAYYAGYLSMQAAKGNINVGTITVHPAGLTERPKCHIMAVGHVGQMSRWPDKVRSGPQIEVAGRQAPVLPVRNDASLRGGRNCFAALFGSSP